MLGVSVTVPQHRQTRIIFASVLFDPPLTLGADGTLSACEYKCWKDTAAGKADRKLPAHCGRARRDNLAACGGFFPNVLLRRHHGERRHYELAEAIANENGASPTPAATILAAVPARVGRPS